MDWNSDWGVEMGWVGTIPLYIMAIGHGSV